MSGGKEMRSSVSFTLPMSCQICLGKVKEPVTCSNHHVFCSSCMNVWLDRNNQCPTCRVEITTQSPIRPIIGGNLSQSQDISTNRVTSRELRRARHELIRKEYEDEIFELENIIDRQKKENEKLKEQIESFPKVTGESSGTSGKPCHGCGSHKSVESMLSLTKKLQDATKTFGKTKKDLSDMKRVNEVMKKENQDLKIENKRIREEISTRSPMKFGRLTVATLQSRLDAAEKQVTQLQKALEKNDQYTEQLETEIKTIRGRKTSSLHSNSGDSQQETSVLSSILNSSEPYSEDLIKQAFQSSMHTPSSKLNELTLDTPTVSCEAVGLERPNSLVKIEESVTTPTENFPCYEYTVDGFPLPAPSPLSPSGNSKSTFSRRLQFDENVNIDENTIGSLYELDNVSDLGLDLSTPTSEIPYDCMDSSSQFSITSETTLNMVNNINLTRSNSDRQSYYQASPSTGMKTTINAGGAKITMMQLSAEEQSHFGRPSSAPSRTFLLSGSKFSALRPVDPAYEGAASGDGFQPVKCISPMHMASKSFTEGERRNKASNSDETSMQNSKNDEEPRGKDHLSRVAILKRSGHSKMQPSQSSANVPSPLHESRRKQKFSFKRTGEMLFESPTKSPKL